MIPRIVGVTEVSEENSCPVAIGPFSIFRSDRKEILFGSWSPLREEVDAGWKGDTGCFWGFRSHFPGMEFMTKFKGDNEIGSAPI